MSKDPALTGFFAPSSVTVVGASTDAGKYSGRPTAYLRRYGYPGRVTAVNPKYNEVSDYPCYPSVADLPDVPDLALIIVPAANAVDAVQECAAKGIRNAIVFGNGFADAGHRERQEQLVESAREAGMRLVGPNCVGVVRPENNLAATFASRLQERMFLKGNVALATQSGSVGNSILQSFEHAGTGISTWVGVGNEADVSILEIVQYLVTEEASSVVAAAIEAVPDPEGWASLGAAAADGGKPVVLLKTGRGVAGQKAATAHSGRMSGDYAVWREITETRGMHVVDSVNELVQDIVTLSRAGGRGKGAFASIGSGGQAVITSDAAERHRVPLASLEEGTRRRLRETLPDAASLANPIDTTPVSDESFFGSCEALLEDPDVGRLLVLLSSLTRDYGYCEDRLLRLAARARELSKVVAVAYYSEHDPLPQQVEHRLGDAGVPVFPDAPRAAAGLALLDQGATAPGQQTAIAKEDEASPSLSRKEAIRALAPFDLPLVEEVTVSSADEAIKAVEDVGIAVMKLDDPAQPHKTENGLVKLGVDGAEAASNAFADLWASRKDADSRVVVEPHVGDGIEVLVAGMRHPEVGPVVAVGSGGILTEFLEDVSFAAAPTTDAEARALLQRTKVSRLLAGYRGGEPCDVDALVHIIEKVSQAISDLDGLSEIELNPVIVGPGGAMAVDILVEAG